MTEAVFTKTFELLHVSQAVIVDGPKRATSWRHRDPGVLVPRAGSVPDPVLFLGAVTFQAEPSHPGAYLWGPVDPGTGDFDLNVDVIDHPLDRVAAYRTAIPMCRAIVDHLSGPHLARTVDGTPVPAIDGKPLADRLPRILVANPETLTTLELLGHAFTYMKVPEDVDSATKADLEIVRAGGRWLREIAALAKYVGQSQVVELLSLLRELYIVPLPVEEQGHLAAVCAAISEGPARAWLDESRFVGPIPDPATQDELWERHNQLRDRLRGRTTTGPGVEATRASLASRYETLAADTVLHCRQSLELAAAVPSEVTFADVRRAEDLARYAAAGSRAVGWMNPGRAVRPILDNYRTVTDRERAVTIDTLRRLAVEPQLRAPLWAAGSAFDGICTSVIASSVPKGGMTPTGRPRMTRVWDIEVEVYDAITLPRVGDTVLWCADTKLNVAGVVTAVEDRSVSIHVHMPATILQALKPGDSDAWLVEKPPYSGPAMTPRRDVLPALFRTARTFEPDTGGDVDDDQNVGAMVAAGADATREYQ